MPKTTKEPKKHSSALVPYSYYRGELPLNYPKVGVHWHGEFELVLIVSGRGELFCEGARTAFSAGDILFILPKKLHGLFVQNGGRFKFSSIVFSPKMVLGALPDRSERDYLLWLTENNAPAYFKIDRAAAAYQNIHRCVCSVMYHAKSGTALQDLYLKSDLFLFFALFFRQQKPVESASKLAGGTLVLPALKYIQSNFGRAVTVRQLAQACSLSPSYFMACFKRAVGLPAMQYLNLVRVENACSLLTNTKKSVAQIAFESGFENLSNFNRVFKKSVGLTPLQYRNQ